MHYVPSMPVPVFLTPNPPSLLNQFETTYRSPTGEFIWRLSLEDHSKLIGHLSDQFGGSYRNRSQDPLPGICAYCERQCDNSTFSRGLRAYNTIDHFRPRKHFNDLTFKWDNLMYVCQRCNDSKKSKFPGKTPDSCYLVMDGTGSRRQYTPPTLQQGYVSPREPGAERYFTYDLESGEINPKDDVNDSDWSKAHKTIKDFNLNPVGGPIDQDLPRLRRESLFTALLFFRSGYSLARLQDQGTPFSSLIRYAANDGFFQNPPEDMRILATKLEHDLR